LPTLLPKKQAFTYENWVWAFTILFSRGVRLRNLRQGETIALVPYADLINHNSASRAYLDAESSGGFFSEVEENVVLYSDRAYNIMDQIFISYGPKPNSDLILLYGFAVERNPFNSVDVNVALSQKEKSFVKEIAEADILPDPIASEKADFLENAGRKESIEFPIYADRFPIEMLQYLRLMHMTPEDTRYGRDFFVVVMQQFVDTKTETNSHTTPFCSAK